MSERKQHLDPVGVSLILGCTVVWGLGQVASKVALDGVPPLTQGGVRSLGAVILIYAWTRIRRQGIFFRDGTWWPGIGAGLLFAFEFAMIYTGLRFTTAGRMTVFLYLAPFVVALGMPLISKSEKLNALQVTGLVVAFAGVAVAFAEGLTSPAALPQQWLGDALGALAALFWGATTLLIRASPALAAAPPAKTLTYQLGVCAVTLTPLGLLLEPDIQWPMTSPVAVSMIFQVVAQSAVSYLVWFWLVQTYAATKLSSFTLLTPVLGLFAGAWLLHEPLTVRLLIGLVAVCAGIYLVNRRTPLRRARRPVP